MRKRLDERFSRFSDISNRKDLEQIIVGNVHTPYRPCAARDEKIPFQTFCFKPSQFCPLDILLQPSERSFVVSPYALFMLL